MSTTIMRACGYCAPLTQTTTTRGRGRGGGRRSGGCSFSDGRNKYRDNEYPIILADDDSTRRRATPTRRRSAGRDTPAPPFNDRVRANSSSSDHEPSSSSPSSSHPQRKSGTILGAVSLIVGTSVGSGILALPRRTYPAGFVPSSVAITLCWLFLVIEALLLAEINVYLWRKRRCRKKDDEEQQVKSLTEELQLEVISLRTMAQETLGDWGAHLATVTYLFLAYTSMVAYTSKSGEVLSHLANLPDSISGIIFTLLLALLMLLGGSQTTDRANQWLTISMIGVLLAIEAAGLHSGGWSDSMARSNWGEVPRTIPVIIFSLVYHDIAPVICAYLGGDLRRIRISILIGSLVPFLSLLVWDGIALNLPGNVDGFDSLDFLMRGRWKDMFPIVEVFSLLAVGTSMLGTLLGFTQFFMEQLPNLLPSPPSTSVRCLDDPEQGRGRIWLTSKKLAVSATAMAVFPSILISVAVPDAFSAATDVAGGYCMTILYGVLPPLMAWAMQYGFAESSSDVYKLKGAQVSVGRGALSNVKPVLIGVGLLSCGIVLEQLLLDLLPV